MATLSYYRNDADNPSCEIVYDDGDRVVLKLDADGLVIERLPSPGRRHEVLVRAAPDTVSRICASLLHPMRSARLTPLDILLAVAIGLGSADRLKTAFREAAAPFELAGAPRHAV